jgi:hypothetical protein
VEEYPFLRSQFAPQRPARGSDHLDADDQKPNTLSQHPALRMPRQRLARIEPVPKGIARLPFGAPLPLLGPRLAVAITAPTMNCSSEIGGGTPSPDFLPDVPCENLTSTCRIDCLSMLAGKEHKVNNIGLAGHSFTNFCMKF